MAKHPSFRGCVAIATLAALVLIGCADEDAGQVSEPAVRVQAAPTTQQTLAMTVRGIGTLRALQTVELRPEIAGTITRIHFEEGGKVARDDLLFELDTRKLQQELAARQAALEASLARRENAERELRRIERLFQRQVATEDARDQSATDLREAEAEVDRLESEVSLDRERIADARIRAPFDGRISEALVDAGDYVKSGDLLATLYRTDELEIEFSLPERYSGNIAPGQRVDITVTAYPDRVFSATTTFVSPSVSDETRDFLVKARLANPDALLKPGTFATALLTIAERERALVVPEESLIATREGYIVFLVGEDGRAHRREVKIGLRNPGVAEITEGLALGDVVIRTGHMRVAEGSPLSVVDMAGSPGG